MGIGTLGFLKGAAGSITHSLDAREEAENEIKKQKQLAQFRNDLEQANAMKKVVSTTREVGADGQVRIVGRNEDLQVIPGKDRLETSGETEAFNMGSKKDKLSIESAEANIRNTNDQIRSRGVNDALDAKYKNASIANMGRERSGEGGSSRSSSSQDVASLIRNDYSEQIKEFVDTDMSTATSLDGKALANRPMEYVTGLSEQAAALALREAREGKKDSSWMYSRARQIFNQGLQNKATNRNKKLNP